MGWDSGFDFAGRQIGYSVEATCDYPDCDVAIDRGLDYACGGVHGLETDNGQPICEGYFCTDHILAHGCKIDDTEWMDPYYDCPVLRREWCP